MNKNLRTILSIIFIIVALILTGKAALGLTEYVTCEEQGLYWICEDGFPDPEFNFEDKGIVVTGDITFSSSSGTGTSPDAEALSLSYTIFEGFEFRDASVTITSGSGTQPSSDGTGGNGGTITIDIDAPKIRTYNTNITYNTGNGGKGTDGEVCSSNAGGQSGNLYVTSDAAIVENINSNIVVNIGDGGDADSRDCIEDDDTGSSGGRAGTIYFYDGINSSSIITNTNYSIILNGGNGGDADVDASGTGGDCKAGGTPSGYNLYAYGNLTGDNYDITTSSAEAGVTDISGDDDSCYGADGQVFYYSFDNMELTNSIFNVKGTNSGNSEARDRDRDGRRGGSIQFIGTSFECSNSNFTLTTGDGGDGDADITGSACGGGGHSYWIVNDTTMNTCLQSFIPGTNGIGGSPRDGGDSGSVYFSVDNYLFNQSPITWTGLVGCDGDNSDVMSGGTGGSFVYAGTGNLSFIDTNMTLQAGNGGDFYRGYGGYVLFSLTETYLQDNSYLSFRGGDRGDELGGSYSGYGYVKAKEINMTNSNLTLHKGYGTTGGYQSQLIADGGTLNVFDKSDVYFTMASAGTANTFRMNGTETLYYPNTTLRYTTSEPDWKTYADYFYFNNASVQGTMDIYNYTAPTNVTYHNDTYSGTLAFFGANHYETFAQYFSRATSSEVTYPSTLPWKNEAYNCTSIFTVGNASVENTTLWYLNDVYNMSGINWNETLSTGDNLTCQIKLNSSEFIKQANNTITIVNAYPYDYTILIGEGYDSYSNSTELNSTLQVVLSFGGFNEYIQYYCDSTVNCSIPIYFSSESNLSSINITNITLGYGVDNTTIGNVNVPFKLTSDSSGIITVDDPVWGYESEVQVPLLVTAHSETPGADTEFGINRWISIIYSVFDITLPFNIDFYDVFPLWPSQKNVEPFGQKSSVPIYNVTSNSTNDMEIRMRFVNGTVPDCATILFNTNNTNALGINLNDTYQELIFNLDNGSSQGLWSWVDFNDCSYNETIAFYPDFYWKAKCKSCVNSTDFWTYNYLNET